MLYVKKELVKNLWPLFPNDKPKGDDIRKFETIGTRSFATEQAIGHAINFHDAIGSKRKEERLRFLKNYWCEKLQVNAKVKLNVSLKPEYACAIGNFSIAKIDGLSGVRVTPHIYTSTKDLDKFIEAVLKIANS
jgi:selenocysteine lyase/cysteine desulfurase